MRLAAFALIAVLAAPVAFAGADRCSEPFGPVVPDGATATQAQMRVSRQEVLNFVKDSDVYQACLIRVIDDPKEELKDSQKTSILKRVDSNQREKEAVAAAFNAALKTFKARGLSLD